jgi:hypothetical protein
MTPIPQTPLPTQVEDVEYFIKDPAAKQSALTYDPKTSNPCLEQKESKKRASRAKG